MKLVADNLRITRKEISEAYRSKDPEPVKQAVRECAKKNPWAIDVNTGPLSRAPEQGMAFFMAAVQAATDLPLLIDTSNPKAMAAGLASAKNPVIINGFSLEPEKLDRVLPLAKRYPADIVGFLLYPDSRVPQDEEQRFEIALELVEKMTAAGVPKERLIIDPVIPPLAWENGIVQARSVLSVIRRLPDLLGFPVRTIGGISNLATRAPDKLKALRITQSYVAMLAHAGLTYALVDILNDDLVAAARTAKILADDTLFSWAMVP